MANLKDNKLVLGTLTLDVPFFQASLSGYSDRAMRLLGRRFGSPLALTGVILDRVAGHPKAVRKPIFHPHPEEHPAGAQILGTDPEEMAAAAKAFASNGFDVIDLNFACPAPKVLRRGRGGALLRKPAKLIEIYRRVRDAVDCPVLIKLRTGYDRSNGSQEDFWLVCELAAQEQIDAVAIHGRTVIQKYRDHADWKILEQVKNKYPNMTIIGSGDIFDAGTMLHKYRNSNLDGILVARGAIGNPWIFSEARALFEDKPKPLEPTLDEICNTMLEHFRLLSEIKGPSKAVRLFRKFCAGYCKRNPERKKSMIAIMECRKPEKLVQTIEDWFNEKTVSIHR